MTSRLPGFYRLPLAERRRLVAERAGLGPDDVAALDGGLTLEEADRMIENVVGLISYPLAVATNFVVDGVERLVPMAVEEASVVAAASNGAKAAREQGGFTTAADEQLMIGQIQTVDVPDLDAAVAAVRAAEAELLAQARASDPRLAELGGGPRALELRVVETPAERMLVSHLLVDCRDAMGANAVNTMAEAIAPEIERLSGGRVLLRIVSNLADRRLITARATFAVPADVADGILAAYRFALHDPYRAATNNKGVMNGVASVGLAVGADLRALEAGAHAYAAHASPTGAYASLTHFEHAEGGVAGRLTLPLAIGTVGGATAAHPAARAALRILGVESARELAGVTASVGLAQQFAAMRALATEGIQRGHMRLHRRAAALRSR